MRANKPGLTIQPYSNDVYQQQKENNRHVRELQREHARLEAKKEANRRAGLFSSPEEMESYQRSQTAPLGPNPRGLGATVGGMVGRKSEDHVAGGKKGRIGPRSSIVAPGYKNARPGVMDISYSKGHKARSVAEVVAAEAGGKTRAQRLSAMKDVYSAAYNRAQVTGQTVESVIAGSKQFSAYNKAMPAGTKNLVGLAEQAIGEVEENGPTHKGTYYARSYATKSLPNGLKQVKESVDDHVYYSDPKNRAIITAAGAIRPTEQPTQVAQAAPEPAGGLASFFADPLGMRAQAAEAPQGLAAFADPTIGATGYNPAKNPANARVDAMFANQVNPAPALSQPSFDARFAAQPTPAQFDARFGAPATAAAERFAPGLQAPAGPFSPEHYAEATAPSSAKARAAFDAVAAGLGAGISSQPESLGATIGAMAGPAPSAPEQGQMSPDGKRPDPFGNEQPGGPLEKVQKAETAQAPGAALAYGEEPTTPQGVGAIEQEVAAAPQGLGLYSPSLMSQAAPALNKPTSLAGLLSPNQMADYQTLDQTSLAMGLTPENVNALQAPVDPQVAEVAGNTIPDPTATYPDAPTPENTFPEAPPEPKESLFGPATKRGLLGLALGGPVGGLLGYASGKLGGLGQFGNTALGPASAGERFGVGSGLAGIQAGMYGNRGATGYSRSNPNTSVTSRGRNLGYDLTNQYGAVTHYDANGNMAGSTPSIGLGGFLSGLFGGGESKKSDKDKDKGGRGLGGINGSGYSGNGLY